MTTPAQWAELVTTALLGTDRRPLDADDPPDQVLMQAARWRLRTGVFTLPIEFKVYHRARRLLDTF